MASSEKPDRSITPLEAALAEYQESWFSGNCIDPELFCQDHPACGPELRKEIDNFLFVVERLPHPGRREKDQSKDDSRRILGDFRILREIGRGGMGRVYEAEQISLNRKVALKILPAHLSFSKDAILKFRREAEAGGKQSHPGIVAIYAVGEHKGVHYIAQELLEEGLTLSDWLTEHRNMEELPPGYFREVARITAEIAEALLHAHESGVLHRDIKPSNILLTSDGHPKVTDFGLARVEGALSLSRTGDRSGTPYYMSPEQVASRRIGIDERTDVFSLGVALYEMLTLARPFEGDTSQEVLKKILSHEPRTPRKVNPRVPGDLAVVCQKAMEKEPANRYSNMGEFAEDLRRYLSGDVILARPAGIHTKFWKWVKRHPAVSAPVGVALLAVLVLVGYILFWSYPQIKEERNKALEARELAESEKEKAVNAEKAAILAKEEAVLERIRASEQAQKATNEATTAEAVLDFLVGLFESPDPSKARGAEITAKEILDRGVIQIQEELTDRPEVKARLLSTMGIVYKSLGQLKEAVPLLEETLDIRRSIQEEDHADVVASKHELALLYLSQGLLEEAEKLFLEAAEQYTRTVGTDDLRTIQVRRDLAAVYEEQGRFEEAEQIVRESLDKIRIIQGDDHYNTLMCMNSLATLHLHQGKYAQADPIYKEVLEGLRRTVGDDHPSTLATIVGFTHSCVEQGKFSEAESLLEEAMENLRRVLGNDHHDMLGALSYLAVAKSELGKYEEAEALLQEALEGQRKVLGNDHSRTLITLNSLGTLYIYQGRFEESEPLLVECFEGMRETLGVDHPFTIGVRSNLGVLYSRLERFDEALPLHEESLEASRRIQGEDHHYTFIDMINLAVVYERLDRLDDAESLLQEALEGYRRIQDENHPNALNAKQTLAGVYNKKGRYEEAESLLLDALETNRQTLGEDHPKTLSTMVVLGNLYMDKKSYDEAQALYVKALEGQRRVLGESHYLTSTTLEHLAKAYLSQGHPDKAEPLMTKSYEAMLSSLGESHPSTLATLHNLILMLMKLERLQKADALAKDLLDHTPKDSKYRDKYEELQSLIKEKLEELPTESPNTSDR